MLFNDFNKVEKTINEIKKQGEKQYLFFDIEEAPKYYEMLEHVIQYKNYSGRYKYYILSKSNAIRLDYLLEAIMIKSDLIQYGKFDLKELEKQIQSEYDLIINLKLCDKNNASIYPSLDYSSIYILGFSKEQKNIGIMFTQFVKQAQQFKLIIQQIVWPQLMDKVKKKLQDKNKNKDEKIKIQSYFLNNLDFYFRQADQLKQKLNKLKKGIYKQINIFFNQVDPRLFDYYLIKFRACLINDVTIFINEINTIINYKTLISNDVQLQALNDIKYAMLQRVNNYALQLICHLNLDQSFQLGFRNMLFEYLQPRINQKLLYLIKDDQQVSLIKLENDNLKSLILQYMADYIQQI